MAFGLKERVRQSRKNKNVSGSPASHASPSEVLVQVEVAGIESFWTTNAEGNLIYLSKNAAQSSRFASQSSSHLIE